MINEDDVTAYQLSSYSQILIGFKLRSIETYAMIMLAKFIQKFF